jgi:methyltransferase
MVSRWLYLGLVACVALERTVELRLSRRNAAAAFAAGGREYGQSHWRAMQLLHTGFLIACPLEVFLLERTFHPGLGVPMLLILGATMALRYWVVATLGERWNTRIIVVPHWVPASGGPYRWLRHPNYLAVVLELVALPLVHGAWITAIVAGILDLAVLRSRIAAEEAALAAWPGYTQALGGRGRFLPHRPPRIVRKTP